MSRVFERAVWAALAALVLAAAAVTASGLLRAPTYEASAEVRVDWRPVPAARGEAMTPLVRGPEEDVELLIPVVDRRPVAEEAARRSGSGTPPGELLDDLTVEQVRDTNVMRVAYRGADPEAAERKTNAFAAVSAEWISESTVSHRGFEATLARRATAPEEPAGPNPVRDGLLTLAVGLALIWAVAEAIPVARRRAARTRDGTRTP